MTEGDRGNAVDEAIAKVRDSLDPKGHRFSPEYWANAGERAQEYLPAVAPPWALACVAGFLAEMRLLRTVGKLNAEAAIHRLTKGANTNIARAVSRAAEPYRIRAKALMGDAVALEMLEHDNADDAGAVRAEAARQLAASGPWAAVAAAGNVGLVAREGHARLRPLCAEVAGVEPDSDDAVMLAARLSDFARDLAEAINAPARPVDADGDRFVPYMTVAMAEAYFGADVPEGSDAPPFVGGHLLRQSQESGVFVWDAILARKLEAIGGHGAKAAAEVLEQSKWRVAHVAEARFGTLDSHKGPGALLCEWINPIKPAPFVPWARLAAEAIWAPILAERNAREAPSVVVSLGKGFTGYQGSDFALVPGIAEPISQFAVNKTPDDQVSTYLQEIGANSDYLDVPESIGSPVYAARGAMLVHRKRWARGRGATQFALAFDTTAEAEHAGALRALASKDIGVTALKMMVVGMANKQSRERGSLIAAHPDEWIALLRGSRFKAGAVEVRSIAKKRADERREIAKAIADVFGFILILPGASAAQAFHVRGFDPENVTDQTTCGLGCSPSFIDSGYGVAGPGRGHTDMLLNMRKFMALNGNTSSLDARAMLTFARQINRAGDPRTGVFNIRSMPWMTPLQIAAECNALSRASIAALDADAPTEAERQAVKNDAARVVQAMERAYKRGIIGDLRSRKTKKRRGGETLEFKYTPPDAYIRLKQERAEKAIAKKR